jgi:sec-independent protein translocase protein TatA
MLAAVFGAPEAVVILILVLVLFGGSQIPKMARNLGQAQKEFKKGLDEGAKDSGDSEASGSSDDADSSSKSDT